VTTSVGDVKKIYEKTFLIKKNQPESGSENKFLGELERPVETF
jgi:hypothetical protein